jgi:hypothetical protein
MKKNLSKSLFRYFYDSLTGSFLGFMIGSMAAGFVSRFFATRSIHNLWGLASHKTLLDKKTYSMLEWFISVLIGFLVFEIISKHLRKRLDQVIPKLKIRLFRWLIRKDLHLRLH